MKICRGEPVKNYINYVIFTKVYVLYTEFESFGQIIYGAMKCNFIT